MPFSDKLPPLAVEALRTLRHTYDRRGPNAFDEDATKVFHVIGSIIGSIIVAFIGAVILVWITRLIKKA